MDLVPRFGVMLQGMAPAMTLLALGPADGPLSENHPTCCQGDSFLWVTPIATGGVFVLLSMRSAPYEPRHSSETPAPRCGPPNCHRGRSSPPPTEFRRLTHWFTGDTDAQEKTPQARLSSHATLLSRAPSSPRPSARRTASSHTREQSSSISEYLTKNSRGTSEWVTRPKSAGVCVVRVDAWPTMCSYSRS